MWVSSASIIAEGASPISSVSVASPFLRDEPGGVSFLFLKNYLLKLNFGFLNDFHSLNCSFPTDFWFLNDFDGLNFSFSLMGMKKFSWI